ncbi:MAG: TetR/AcrR family transcriptional regulator [Prolixibacteraceae bacterium]|nr:TetR/AcrR family transcriptional regulator [Prolixibacteraceae bacterium]
MPRTPEQYEQIRKEKKLVICETALELFAQNGYHATPISLIVKKANMSKGLLYNYFESKEELLTNIIDNGFNELIDNFDLNKDNILTDEEFEYFLHSLFKILDSRRSFWKLYFSLMLQISIAPLIEPRVKVWYDMLISILEDFFKKRNIKNPRTEALTFGAMLDGLSFDYIINPDMFPVNDVVNHIIDKYQIKNQ